MVMNTKSFEPKMDWGILLLLFLLAWGVRVIGLDWGYLHGDERVNQAAKVLAGELVPDQHFYPPLMHYVAAVLFGGLYVVGRAFDMWSSTAEFRGQYFQDPTIFYLTARAMTGAISALMAPLFFRIARVLGFGRTESIFVGLFAVFAPLTIALSYIFKGDVGVATVTIWIILLMVRKVQLPEAKWIDIGLGILVVLGLSFKHSFVLLMLPLAFVYLVVMGRQMGLLGTFASLGRIFLVAVILWPILNIGIVLDFQNFLKFQEIQSVMSISESANFAAALGMMLRRAMDWQLGITVLMPYAFLAFPIFAIGMSRAGMLVAVWVATVASLVAVAYLVGTRQPEQLWVAHFAVVQLFAAISLICLYRLSRPIGAVAITAVLAMTLIGDIAIWQQTTVRAVNQDVAVYIERTHPERRVMTTLDLPLPQTRDAQDYEWARVMRTADKYNLQMPEIAPERRIPEDRTNAFFVVPMPEVMFGLEGTTDADMEGRIAPYAWPPQAADWKLENWLADGVDLFVVSDLAGWLGKDNAPVMQAFFVELETKCSVIQSFQARKPLFLEREVQVLDCSAVKFNQST